MVLILKSTFPATSNVSDKDSSISLGLRVRTENTTLSQPTRDIQFTAKRQNFKSVRFGIIYMHHYCSSGRLITDVSEEA